MFNGAGLSIVGTIVGIMSALAGPAAPIIVPIAAGVIFATLFLVTESQELSHSAIKLAVASYFASLISGDVHTRIQEYDKGLKLLEDTDRGVLDKIAELMQLYSIGAETISKLRAAIPAMGSSPDEPWEAKNT
ncbi:hypothetical protein BDR03DRAFT_1016921 [Suillus americanus]|nr:hypothetical protein BDR03DRAFT_1016921 [Suillus americanus]